MAPMPARTGDGAGVGAGVDAAAGAMSIDGGSAVDMGTAPPKRRAATPAAAPIAALPATATTARADNPMLPL